MEQKEEGERQAELIELCRTYEGNWPCFDDAKIVFGLYKQLVNYFLTGTGQEGSLASPALPNPQLLRFLRLACSLEVPVDKQQAREAFVPSSSEVPQREDPSGVIE